MTANASARLRTLLKAALLAALALACGSAPAQAQIPPHYPGTICLTPTFWCWLPQPGPINGPCYCATPAGYVPGRVI